MKEDTTTASISPSTAKTNGKWQSKDATKAVQGLQDQVMTGAKEAYDNIVENASGAFSKINTSATGLVRQYPIQTAVGALAVGFLLGAAVTRRGE